METIKKIYIKGIIQLHRKLNGWSDNSITSLLMKMNKDSQLFNVCARGVRGKYSYSAILSRLENGYKF